MKRIIMAALLAAAASAHALTGNELLQMMQNSDSSSKLVVLAYLRGFSDASQFTAYSFRVTKEGKTVNAQFFCQPSGVTADQMRDLVQAELVAQAAQRQIDAAFFVYSALGRAWPCPGG